MHFHVRTYDLGHKAAQGDLGKKDHFRIGHAMPSVGLEGDRGSFSVTQRCMFGVCHQNHHEGVLLIQFQLPQPIP